MMPGFQQTLVSRCPIKVSAQVALLSFGFLELNLEILCSPQPDNYERDAPDNSSGNVSSEI